MLHTSLVSRRDALKTGLLAAGGLTLSDIFRARAAQTSSRRDTAVIFVQLGGGPPQFETYDPKPNAPSEYRGAFHAIPTSVPGVRFCELMPRQAQLMDQLAIVRSVTHHEASHIALHVIETGFFLRSVTNILKGEMPAIGCIASRLRGRPDQGLPGFVSLPKAIYYCSPSHLGGQYAPFNVDKDPSQPEFEVANLALGKGLTTARLEDRQSLLEALDRTHRALGIDATARSLDVFQAQALDLLTGETARRAFDLNREPAEIRDRYGRNEFGQRLLLSRRLVEAGVPFVMVRTADWDDHKNLIANMKKRGPIYDTGMAALIRDLGERGLNRDVLVVSMGEFGRTPRMNQDSGRDHWPAVASVLLSGGHYRMGQVIGASDSHGGAVAAAPYSPQSILAMIYRHLGIDPAQAFPDLTGRPRHILEERQPIAELG